MGTQRDHHHHPDHDDGVSGSDGLPLLLREAQRLVEELKSYLQLHQLLLLPSTSSLEEATAPAMDAPLVPAAGGAGALPALVDGISGALSRAVMLLPTAGARSPPPARRGSGGNKKRGEASQLGRWRKEVKSSMELEDDGYSWRKYGQKQIFAAKYPRSYFRCKHKYDRLCPATRQVQPSEADPSLLEITYIGHHTCTQPQHPQAPQPEDAPAPTTATTTKQLGESDPSATFDPTVKHEIDVPLAPPSHSCYAGDHGHGGGGGAPVHRFQHLHDAFSFVAFDRELGGHAAGVDLILDGYYTDGDAAYYTAADAGAGDHELAAAASAFGVDAAMMWEFSSYTSDD